MTDHFSLDAPSDDDTPRDAEEQLALLRDALQANAITLPSLGLDLPNFAARYAQPLIALGNCNLATAEALTAALLKAAAR
ncbi:hypothetical protein [Streptomyces catenulae]|uniref:Uncharacterized protein n=1 Tax=Streptomyces catenulae TaxID=66875 RepID=A0ABV2Z1T4_9ACTN|nr:hypothetical protein [Streptomyces catenulae]